MSTRTKLTILVSLALLLAALWGGRELSRKPSPRGGNINLQNALSDGAKEFAEVKPGRKFQFPADHGEHPDFKTEWWYFTGNLKAEESEDEIGYQLTIFRSGIGRSMLGPSKSSWNAQDLVMGHLAISSKKAGKFYSFERFSRRALGLAGFEDNAQRIWIENWQITRTLDAQGGWTLSASSSTPDGLKVAMELELEQSKPTILQGQQGYSRKGPRPEDASYYVAQTRLSTSGTVTLGDREMKVSGLSWFDHEWSSAALASGLVGWDWFSLQLDDGWDIMLYLLRYQDGRIEPASSGALIDPKGERLGLSLQDFSVETKDTHISPTGVEYPSLWTVSIPSHNLELTVKPKVLDQEMKSAVPYWEGAVSLVGRHKDNSVEGSGFVEMTGYATQPAP